MKYIDAQKNPSGAYPNPKNQPFPGCIAIDDEQSKIFLQYNGYVNIESTDGVAASISPNIKDWEAWKASLPPEAAPGPSPEEDTDAMLVDHEYRITLLELGVE